MVVKPEFLALLSPISSHHSPGTYESSPPLGTPVYMTESEGDEKEK